MSRGSLQLRLIVAAAISISLAVSIAGFLLIRIFERNLVNRIDEELATYVNQIAGNAQFAADGNMLEPEALPDPRFQRAYGGLYWQIDDQDRSIRLRSESLWDFEIPLPADDHATGEIHRYRLAGPEGNLLIVQERQLVFATPTGRRPIRIAVGLDEADIVNSRARFATDIFPYLIVLAIFLVLAAGVQVWIGLRPLKAVRLGLDAISERRQARLHGMFPSEIQRLVTAVNSLLTVQEKTTDRARRRAADLAHGLKTPLTALRGNAERLRQSGQHEIASEIEEMTSLMKAQIDHELIRTRIAPDPLHRKSDADLAAVIDQIVRTLKKTPIGENLAWLVTIPAGASVAVDPDDLRELAGNLAENAAKWARSRVEISGTGQGDLVILTIADDGPGVAEDKIPQLFKRGIRFDQKVPGTGLGLSIVKDIADVYSLETRVTNRQPSGLQVEVDLPLAPANMKKGGATRRHPLKPS